VGKQEGKRLLGIPTSKREDNVRTDLKETGCSGTNCIHTAQESGQRRALMNMVTVMCTGIRARVLDFM
jgi:hypothetical protein